MEFYDCDLWSWCQYRNFRPLNPTGFRMLQTSQWGLLDRPTRQDNVDGCCMLLQVRSDCCRKVCVGETFLRTLKRLSPACFLSYGNVFILKWVFQRFWRISTYFNCPNPSKPKTGSLRPLPASVDCRPWALEDEGQPKHGTVAASYRSSQECLVQESLLFLGLKIIHLSQIFFWCLDHGMWNSNSRYGIS